MASDQQIQALREEVAEMREELAAVSAQVSRTVTLYAPTAIFTERERGEIVARATNSLRRGPRGS